MIKCSRCNRTVQDQEKLVVLNLIDKKHAPFCLECFTTFIVPDMTMTGKEFERSYGKPNS